MDLLIFLVIFFSITIFVIFVIALILKYFFTVSGKAIKRYFPKSEEFKYQDKTFELIQILTDQIPKYFLIQPCARCSEYRMKLIDISPNARSIEYECIYCDKKMRALAGSKESLSLINYWQELKTILNDQTNDYNQNETTHVIFYCPPNPLPYEKTRREPIPETIRSQVWRRDNGKCVQCTSIQNLQFDHIIPVSKGGATTIENLQILCQQCNLAKHSKI